MKLKYIGILRRDGSAPSVKNGDEVIQADKNNVINVDKSLAEALIESNLWAPEKSSSNDTPSAPAQEPVAQQSETSENKTDSTDETQEAENTESNQDGGEVQQDSNADNADANPENQDGAPQDKKALVDYAKSLGIDAKATWGIQKLNEAIAKANASQG